MLVSRRSCSEQIFNSFYSTKPVDKGSGLGLAICRQIAAHHNGRIELQSAVGQGTTFCVLLPIDDQEAVMPPVLSSVRRPGRCVCWWSTTTQKSAIS